MMQIEPVCHGHLPVNSPLKTRDLAGIANLRDGREVLLAEERVVVDPERPALPLPHAFRKPRLARP